MIRSLLIYGLFSLVSCDHFLWFENEPDPDDPCTLTVIGGERGDIACHHLPASCKDHGGFIHWANFGRVWLHLFIDVQKKQEFELCVTSGAPERTYIWYDYARQHWEPMVFDAWFGLAARVDCCKKSINGTMDLFFEAPWWYPNFVSYVKWNITEIEDYQPKPWPPVEKVQETPHEDVDEGAAELAPEIIKKKKEEKEKQKKKDKKKRKGRKKKSKNKGKKEEKKPEEPKQRPRPGFPGGF